MTTDGDPAISNWSDLTGALPVTDGWMHSGIAISPDGVIYCAHPEGHALVVIAPGDAGIVVPIDLTEPHGIALTRQEGVLAVADAGYRVIPEDADQHYVEEFVDGRAALVDAATGLTVLELSQPDLPVYADACWRPTSIAVDRDDLGSGDIWVADGYGASLIHRFDSRGTLLASFDGAAGQVFDCPHGVMLRRRGGDLEVLVADRAHHRIVVMGVDGDVRRVFGQDELDSPSSLALLDDDLFVTELFGGVAQFDADDRFVRRLESRRSRSKEEPGWPNRLGADGRSLLPARLTPATFNSPHGIAVHGGSLYVTEWLIGGRLVRITP